VIDEMNLIDKAINGSRIIKAKVLGERKPFSMNLKITHRCNKRCNYCNITESTVPEMTTEQIKQMIDEFHAAGMMKFSINGGEPLLRDDIGEIIDYAHKKKIITIIVTNGELLKYRIKELSNVDMITFSFDGDKETQDANRGKGTFEKTVEAIDLARAYNMNVFAQSVLTANSVGKMKYVADFCKDRKIKLNVQALFDYDFASETVKEMMATKENFRAGVKEIIKLKKEGYPIVTSDIYLQKLLNWPEPMPMKCYASQFFCNVSPDGKVFPCMNFLDKEEKGYDGFELGFNEAFLRTDKGDCDKCWALCYNEYNQFFSLSPTVVQEALRMIK